MNSKALSAAIVGHTNAGKTSLMRTLLRDADFGAVSNHPGTTRHVEGGELMVDGEGVIKLFDTPGLEDSIGLLEVLENCLKERNTDGVERLRFFVTNLDKYPQFDQEAKVVRQLLQNDLVFYVIDVREPILGKYRDELQILSFAARPVIPVLNFIAGGAENLSRWKEQLARLNLHTQVEFDTVIFNFEGEKRLYQKIQSLVAEYYDEMQRLIDDRQRQWEELHVTAADLIARLFVDVAAYRTNVADEKEVLNSEIQHMQKKIRNAESLCVSELMSLFRFSADDVGLDVLPVKDGEWNIDLFDSENFKQFGIQAGSSAAKGAVVGAGVDVMVGGLSFGAGTAIGALAGVFWSTGSRFGEDIAATIKGSRKVCVDESTLKVLWLRQQYLLNALEHRGHATQDKLVLASKPGDPVPNEWDQWLKRLRANDIWSRLNSKSFSSSSEREAFIQVLSRTL